MAKSRDGKIIKEIIKRYGDTIDLARNPYLIVEIIRQYGPKVDGGVAAECLPPGGPPPPSGPHPTHPDPSYLLEELRVKAEEMNRLSAALQKALKRGLASKAKR